MPDQLTSYKPQSRNANKHTQRGMGLLEQSIQADGWTGAITVAADGETFDGSARLEVAAATGFENAIVVESDGTRPIIHRRTDIPTADDERAKRLGVAANRVASLNLDWDAGVLAELAAETDLSQLFQDDELTALLAGVTIPDPEPQQEPTLASACYIEIYCTQNDLNDFRGVLAEWGARKSVTINIQE